MTTRKLTTAQEREVCLAYFCAVGTDYIAQRWKISDSLIRLSIVGTRSREWDDQLVEFYRKTNPRNRGKNAAHLLLVFNGARDLPQAELIDPEREETAYAVVKSNFYDPYVDAIAKETSLSRYLSTKVTGLERLLSDVNPTWRTPERIINRLLLEKLHEEYNARSAVFSMNTVYEKGIDCVSGKVKQGALAMTPEKIKFIQEVLGTLTEQQCRALSLLYNPSGDKMSWEQVSDEMGVTKARIGQLKVDALTKLRYPSRARRLSYVAGLVTDEEVVEYRARIQAQDSQAHQGIPLSEVKLTSNVQEIAFLTHRIKRSLGRAGVRTVVDLLQRTEKELLGTPGFGPQSIQEVVEILNRLGLKLRTG